jgi:hypothetical protein
MPRSDDHQETPPPLLMAALQLQYLPLDLQFMRSRVARPYAPGNAELVQIVLHEQARLKTFLKWKQLGAATW